MDKQQEVQWYLYIGPWMDAYEYRRTGSTTPVLRWIYSILRDEDTSQCVQHGNRFYRIYGPLNTLSPEEVELVQSVEGAWQE